VLNSSRLSGCCRIRAKSASVLIADIVRNFKKSPAGWERKNTPEFYSRVWVGLPPISRSVASIVAHGPPVVIYDHGVGKIVNGETMAAGEGDPFVFQIFQQVRAGNLFLAFHHWREVQRH
jgi:hypothetical protein